MHAAVTTVIWEEKKHNLVASKLQTSVKNTQELLYTHIVASRGVKI
jgi:hypothetical protein